MLLIMLMVLTDGIMAMTMTVIAKLNLMAVTAARRLIYNYFIGTYFCFTIEAEQKFKAQLCNTNVNQKATF